MSLVTRRDANTHSAPKTGNLRKHLSPLWATRRSAIGSRAQNLGSLLVATRSVDIVGRTDSCREKTEQRLQEAQSKERPYGCCIPAIPTALCPDREHTLSEQKELRIRRSFLQQSGLIQSCASPCHSSTPDIGSE